MNKAFFDIYISIASAVLDIDLKSFKKIFDKEKLKSSENLEISQSIDTVSKKLEDSKEIIENALIEMEKQKKLYEEMKKEAEISRQITSLNQEQVSALNEFFENMLKKQEKRTSPKNLLWSLFFCILSAVLGIVLGKFI